MTTPSDPARRARPPLEAERPQHPTGPALILVLVVVVLIVALSVASVYT